MVKCNNITFSEIFTRIERMLNRLSTANRVILNDFGKSYTALFGNVIDFSDHTVTDTYKKVSQSILKKVWMIRVVLILSIS
jgi:DNA-binding ferritin-like protein